MKRPTALCLSDLDNLNKDASCESQNMSLISADEEEISVENKATSGENNSLVTLDISIEIASESEKSMGAEEETKKTRKRVLWSLLQTVETYTEAHTFLTNNGFKKHQTKTVKAGQKAFYRCGAIKQRSKIQCEAKRMIFQDYSKVGFEIFESNTDHTCDQANANERVKCISEEMKKLIMACAGNRMTPKYIAKHIDKIRVDFKLFVNEKTPSVSQIAYLIRAHKNKTAPKMVYLGQLIEWCEGNTAVPENIDDPFVIGYEHSDESSDLNFKIVVSTQRMIQHCTDVHTFCVDATYKLNWHGLPFIVVGKIDKNKKFHALSFALCVNEKTEDFRFIFETIAENVQKFTGSEFKPEILVSDACLAIRNAFAAVFPEHKLMVMCFVHVLRNVEKNRDKYQQKNKAEIIRDIQAMQLASSREIFDNISALFIKKWMKREKAFVKYFRKQWLSSHCNWFEGVSDYTPSHNNSLEGKH